MNLKKFALSTAAAVMFGSFALAQGPAPEPKEGDRPEPPRPEMSENHPEDKGPAKVHREHGPKDVRHNRGDRPMPPRHHEARANSNPATVRSRRSHRVTAKEKANSSPATVRSRQCRAKVKAMANSNMATVRSRRSLRVTAKARANSSLVIVRSRQCRAKVKANSNPAIIPSRLCRPVKEKANSSPAIDQCPRT